ncbi:MAG TPA: HepT-like ribonuclease domain-containing protein [Acidobacteriota bacterium]|nr:HepT-like ribonuclease domain-containing protein [Acidobacteriota bacterium]
MNLDKERLDNYLLDIKKRNIEIEDLLEKYTDKQIVTDSWLIRGLKYLLIEIAEIMANTLIHIITKDKGESVTGYIETIVKSGEIGILSKSTVDRLKPFFDFRNSLVHRYWIISDEKLVELVRKNHKDFYAFIEEIEKYVKK